MNCLLRVPAAVISLMILLSKYVVIANAQWQCGNGKGGTDESDAVDSGDRMQLCIFMSFGDSSARNKINMEVKVGELTAVVVNAQTAAAEALSGNQCGVYCWATTKLPVTTLAAPKNCTGVSVEKVGRSSCLQTYMTVPSCDSSARTTGSTPEKIMVVPTSTLRIRLVDGIVDTMTWDQGCQQCSDASKCVDSPQWMEHTGSSYKFSSTTQNRSVCSKQYKDSEDNPFRVYIAWEGTGKSGRMIFGSEFSLKSLADNNIKDAWSKMASLLPEGFNKTVTI